MLQEKSTSILYSQTNLDYDKKTKTFKQIHFLLCESCFWCATSYLSPKNVSVAKCPNCYNNKIKWMPVFNIYPYKLGMTRRLQTIEQGNHIIAVYPNKYEKFHEAFAFLKDGLQRNEVYEVYVQQYQYNTLEQAAEIISSAFRLPYTERMQISNSVNKFSNSKYIEGFQQIVSIL
jgi:hypothetical protein